MIVTRILPRHELDVSVAKRLTVIISQSSMRHSQAADVEERLLTELMMADGMDATLVGPLDSVQLDSTDYLCLSGFGSQTLAVVSSLSFEQVAQQWSRLQLGGQVVRMGQAGPMGLRRVVYFPLTSDVPATLRELGQLLLDQAVKVVGVIMPLGKTAQPLPRSLARSSSPAQISTGKSSDSGAAPSPPAASQPLPTQLPVSQPSEMHAQLEEEWPDLDRLVDDLDALDL